MVDFYFRKSRLPVDTRRASTLRNSSATKTSARKRSCSGDTATERSNMMRRYGSANSLNNMNTPQRFMMTPGDATPLMSLRRSTMMSTDRGRRENNENCARIMEILQRDGEFFGQLNLMAGLKSMTAKQFLQIITYFMHMIGGKAATSNKEYQADPLNGILKFLKMLNCPYMVTKSAMKTPNAPHTFDQLVTLMMWLAEFAGDDDSELVPDEIYLQDEKLPSLELTATFSREIETGFILWNKQNDDEFGKVQDQLVDAFIMAKTNGHAKSVGELERATAASKQRIEQLDKMPCTLANEKQYEAMESQYLKYEEIEHNLKQNIVEKRDLLAAVELKWTDSNEVVLRKETHIKEIQMQIDTQTKSIGEYKQLLDRLAILNISIDERKAEIETIKELNTANEVRSARLLNQKLKSVADYNVHMMNVCQLVNRCQIGLKVDPNRISLDCQATLATLKTIRHEINQINSAASKRRAFIDIEEEKLSNHVELLQQKEQNNNAQLNEHRAEMKKLAKQLKTIEMNKLSANEMNEKRIAELESKLKRLQVDLASGRQIIAELETKRQLLEQESAEQLNSFEAKAMELLRQKQELVDSLDEGIEMINQYERLLGMADLSEQFNGITTSTQENDKDER